MNKIYFDIETIPSGTQQTATESEIQNITVAVTAKYKKAETQEKHIIEQTAKLYEKKEAEYKKRSLSILKAKIICLSYAINDQEVKTLQGTEFEILSEFEKVVSELDLFFLIGHNATDFDAPIVSMRAKKYGLPALAALGKNDIYCTMKNGLNGLAWGQRFSLSDMCEFFDIKTPKDAMTGADVFPYYQEGRLDEIITYCEKDVQATRELYKFLRKE
jgi:DNA polymerase elongation subunit (family B)